MRRWGGVLVRALRGGVFSHWGGVCLVLDTNRTCRYMERRQLDRNRGKCPHVSLGLIAALVPVGFLFVPSSSRPI